MIALLMMAAVSVSPPREAAFAAAAKRCGLKPDQIVWVKETRRRPSPAITPNGDLNRLSAKSITCILRWSKKKRFGVGFLSEPPPSH